MSSLLQKIVNYSRKKFYNIGPWMIPGFDSLKQLMTSLPARRYPNTSSWRLASPIGSWRHGTSQTNRW